MVGNPPATAGAAISIPGSERCPGGGNAICSSFLAGKSHGQRSLAGYSLWGGKESDVTEQLSMYMYNIHVVSYIYIRHKYIVSYI